MNNEIKTAIGEGFSSDELLAWFYMAREVLELTDQEDDDTMDCMDLLTSWCRPEESLRSE